MSIALQHLTDIASWGFDDIIDVRSPSEFAEDHIPGAISLPVLSDEERAIVGTIYVQDDRFKARRVGAALVARNAADHIEQRLSEKDGSWRPLVHCWRGGQRSGSFASILSQIGWRAELLEGGYKAYRRLVVDTLYDKPISPRLILIDGNTGTAKTEILHLLQLAGAQMIDLEGLAAHRGSLFGAIQGGQPSQKMFESRLAKAVVDLDPNRPVFVEAESNKIGERSIPTSFWRAMSEAPRITVKSSLSARSEFLLRSYWDLLENQQELLDRLSKLQSFHSKDRLSEWIASACEGRFKDLAEGLMEHHYDPRYAKTFQRRERQDLGSIELKTLDTKTLGETAIPQILEMSKRLD
ncbi:MAG: tRNA 2-selenouridine(34) synthase MnmH [Paracoccaceae bacterium]|jgi:tRNA 2-selenouridine synthase|nr:tRNA 2-selenouridine(34) synthase MnmH [Paracoccaceae bacterium]